MPDDISTRLFAQSLEDNGLSSFYDKNKKKTLPHIFLKLDAIFKNGPPEFKDYTVVQDYAEGLWMRHEGEQNPLSGPDRANCSWNQSKIVVIISKGEYHPILRNFLAKRLNIKEGILIEIARLNDLEPVVITKYTFEDCRLEAVVNEKNSLKLIISCPVIRLESKDIDKITLDQKGSIVSELNLAEHRVK